MLAMIDDSSYVSYWMIPREQLRHWHKVQFAHDYDWKVSKRACDWCTLHAAHKWTVMADSFWFEHGDDALLFSLSCSDDHL